MKIMIRKIQLKKIHHQKNTKAVDNKQPANKPTEEKKEKKNIFDKIFNNKKKGEDQ